MAKWMTSSLVAALATLAPSFAAAAHFCPTATSAVPTPRTMTSTQRQQAMTNLGAPLTAGFSITIELGPGLVNNTAAREALLRAAGQWTSRIRNRIGVRIRFDAQPLGTGVLGRASSTFVVMAYGDLRTALVNAAVGEADDGIVSSLPFAVSNFVRLPPPLNGGNAGPVTQAVATTFVANKALLKAAGLQNLDLFFGPLDAQVVFTTDLPFDFDNRDGVPDTQFDFEAVAAHEIGHSLGFSSLADLAFLNAPAPLDLFRFERDPDNLGPGDNPDNATEFFFFPRTLVPTAPLGGAQTTIIFDDTTRELAFSQGTGFDGRQASHWQDDVFQFDGLPIGIMDPTLNPGMMNRVNNNDLRALDLVGYKVFPNP